MNVGKVRRARESSGKGSLHPRVDGVKSIDESSVAHSIDVEGGRETQQIDLISSLLPPDPLYLTGVEPGEVVFTLHPTP